MHSTTLVCPHANGSLCPPGDCVAGPPGTFGSATNSSSALCSGLCSAGQFSGGGTTACAPCLPGQYANTSGAAACQSCSAGTYGLYTGSTTVDDCAYICTPTSGRVCMQGANTSVPTQCPPGQFSLNGSYVACDPCPAGYFCAASGTISPSMCPLGRYSVGFASNCTICPAGRFCVNSSYDRCDLCPAGSYCASVGVGAPTLCPAGQYSLPGATNCTTCQSGFVGTAAGLSSPTCSRPCNASIGSYCAPNGTVSACGVGTYSDIPSAMVCQRCAVGQFGNTTGLSTPSCTGWCPPGRYSGPGASSCTLCTAGKYAGLGASSCSVCPAGQFGSGTGLANATCSGACVPAPGRYCSLGATTRNGAACPKGQYSTLGDLSVSGCTLCPLGQYGSVVGATDFSSGCSGACIAPLGYFCPDGAASSNGYPCEYGKWSSGFSPCLACAPGKYGRAGSNSSACTGTCPPGQFSASGARACTLCPAGSYSGPGAGSCDVPVVSWPGKNTCATLRLFCTLGALSGVSGAVGPCASGRYRGDGMLDTPCSPGQYADVMNETQCRSCPPGRYAPNAGLATCPPCPTGLYSSVPGAVACTMCPAGWYGGVGVVGLTSSSCSGPCVAAPGFACGQGADSPVGVACTPGRYSDGGANVLDCTNCPAGR
jgi:hypothetical protein